MTFEQIANEYSWGSHGFIDAVQTHCGFGISWDEAERISDRASTPAEFEQQWADETWWTDKAD